MRLPIRPCSRGESQEGTAAVATVASGLQTVIKCRAASQTTTDLIRDKQGNLLCTLLRTSESFVRLGIEGASCAVNCLRSGSELGLGKPWVVCDWN